MKINNEFTVTAPIEQAWNTMLDLEKIAPCLPGAAIKEDRGDGEYDGTMKVKIGPITASYKGTVKFEETDEVNRRAVLQATGRDARGQGTASATITSTLAEEGANTRVSVETDMKLTGRAAQFGRGIAQDVATKMLNQFAACLEREISGGGGAEAAESPAAPTTSGNGTAGTSAGSHDPPPAVGGTAGRIVSSEDPTVAAGGAVEGAVVAGSSPTEAAASAPTTPQPAAQPETPRRDQGTEESEAFDVGAAGQEALLKRFGPVLVGAGLLLVFFWLLRRRG